MSKKVDVIVDLQYGSTGKGLIAGFLAKRNGYDTVINANMPNAGHTFIDANGRKWIHKVLPNGIVSPSLRRVMIGPGSVFDVDRMIAEMIDSIDLLAGVDIVIHPMACVLTDAHRNQEQNAHSNISSTMQGSGAASIHKMLRNNDDSPLIKDNSIAQTKLKQYARIVSVPEWQQLLFESKKILLEAAQGYSLGINSGFWPYCTSRECTPARFMSDCGIPLSYLSRVIGTARTYPIRVGNTKDGTSGPCYRDQREIQWSDIGVTPEKTTVTNRDRRIFTFSRSQITQAMFECAPDDIFLNFCNYVHPEHVLLRMVHDINRIAKIYCPIGSRVKYVGYGPQENDIQPV